ncbi:MAG: Lrp/AsnC family transcriptional regulator [Chloroflexi bacterium]|nr:Lrp/AsnC family transcriptional regulator [Chloroflexota bacterium]
MQLDTVDRKLLNLLQSSFPLEKKPYAAVAEKLGMGHAEVMGKVRCLKEAGIIRNIGGIFESSRLGYRSTLVAMHIPESRLNESASRISEHQGVSHNYARDHYYNLWFTLTVPPGANVTDEVAALDKLAGSENTLNLPAIRVFKIRVFFDMLDGGKNASSPAADGTREFSRTVTLSEADREVVKVLQQDLPIRESPFDDLAAGLGLTAEDLLAKARALQSQGVMRRYSVSLRHRKAGFSANAMSCWIVPQDRIEETGQRMAGYKEVSHCYQRPTSQRWPYGIFTMIHGPDKGACQEVAARISRDTGIADYIMLYSTTEYKKERVQYFV